MAQLRSLVAQIPEPIAIEAKGFHPHIIGRLVGAGAPRNKELRDGHGTTEGILEPRANASRRPRGRVGCRPPGIHAESVWAHGGRPCRYRPGRFLHGTEPRHAAAGDRKSTRLNSSHSSISYA